MPALVCMPPLNNDQCDPFDSKAAALVAYCFADGLPRTRSELLAMDQLKVILTATNIKRYLQFFRDNWNEHWPTVHMPTFSTLEANNGLLLAMMCVGAIYSNEMGLEMERWLMVLIRQAVERSFETIKLANGHSVGQSGFEYSSTLIEEIEAVTLLQSMFIWHGTAEHRQQARDDFALLVSIIRKCRLTQPVPLGQKGYSMLHQSHQNQANIDLTKWDWSAWTQQEERSRVMLQIYLIDCAMAMFFNTPPQLSPNEIQIQLPADDAAFDATSAESCMNALGMNGDDAQNLCNVSGSKRLSQPEFHLCMQLLFSAQSEFAPRTTNIYSKFLLIHALHAQIWSLQNQSLTQGQGAFGIGSLPSTPLSQHDWVSSAGSYTASNPSSGRATPTESFPNANPQQVNALRFALEKWKRAWETDIDIQYPPTGSPSSVMGISPRRIGFCRDAVHYYWLAKQFLSSPRTFNWQAYSQPDQRMGFVMGVLKQIRTYVAKEGFRLGKELGSVVDIKEDYAVDMSKLNMRDLFVTLPGAKS